MTLDPEQENELIKIVIARGMDAVPDQYKEEVFEAMLRRGIAPAERTCTFGYTDKDKINRKVPKEDGEGVLGWLRYLFRTESRYKPEAFECSECGSHEFDVRHIIQNHGTDGEILVECCTNCGRLARDTMKPLFRSTKVWHT